MRWTIFDMGSNLQRVDDIVRGPLDPAKLHILTTSAVISLLAMLCGQIPPLRGIRRSLPDSRQIHPSLNSHIWPPVTPSVHSQYPLVLWLAALLRLQLLQQHRLE